jgi:hypothetical protein
VIPPADGGKALASHLAPFLDRSWERLLDEIHDGGVVPVVGPEVLRTEIDGRPVRLLDHVASLLRGSLRVEGDVPEGSSLAAVAAAFLARQGDPGDLHFEIHELVAKTPWPVPDALRLLAAIEDFDLYISTTIDRLLKRALDETRFGGEDKTREIAYSNLSRVDDLPEESQAEDTAPTVFQVFGRASIAPVYAVTEEDVLEFAHRLQDPDRQPPVLFQRLRDRHLLFIGCNLPDWLTRFLLRCTKGERFFVDRNVREVFADDVSLRDAAFVQFLERRRARMYREGDAVRFVQELHQRWRARFTAPRKSETGTRTTPPPPFKAGAVFVSYAREDVAVATAFTAALDAAKVDVWIDQRSLEPGDAFKAKILRNIEQCSFFVPVISRHTADPGRRFFWLEWRKAMEEAQMRPVGFPFLLPIVVDDTSPNAQHVPEPFRGLETKVFPGGTPSPEFVETLRQRLRDLRRGRPGSP